MPQRENIEAIERLRWSGDTLRANSNFTGYLASLFTGAASNYLLWQQLAKVKVLGPPKPLLDFAGPIEHQLKLPKMNTRRAVDMRDILPPHLMSGELAA
jgi:hypothetical protein